MYQTQNGMSLSPLQILADKNFHNRVVHKIANIGTPDQYVQNKMSKGGNAMYRYHSLSHNRNEQVAQQLPKNPLMANKAMGEDTRMSPGTMHANLFKNSPP